MIESALSLKQVPKGQSPSWILVLDQDSVVSGLSPQTDGCCPPPYRCRFNSSLLWSRVGLGRTGINLIKMQKATHTCIYMHKHTHTHTFTAQCPSPPLTPPSPSEVGGLQDTAKPPLSLHNNVSMETLRRLAQCVCVCVCFTSTLTKSFFSSWFWMFQVRSPPPRGGGGGVTNVTDSDDALSRSYRC